ncbi:MAG: tRNA (N(6)-L-threonylcarbamoyladenosine(37)-C(2))-methylthiotransferase MtaB [Planctomycetes bacterium]|nr:tRNA (N(6)-L-threonylcarbamoyladenosine(37)-C(2))-methylthiotransferase MtaB [Planctomycetota bacterium]
MKVNFHTLGCRLNQSESAILAQSFIDSGYDLTDDKSPSDVCVINTCTVTSVSDSKCRNSIRKLIRKNPQARIAVIGCYAEAGFEEISSIEGVDLVIGNEEKLNLLKYLPEEKLEKPRLVKDKISKDSFSIDTIGQATGRTRASLKIQDGCDFICSFCIIPRVRGRARGRDFDNLLVEAKELVERGYKELVLTGVNIGTYEVGGKNIEHVLDALSELYIPRIRISSIEPTTITEGVLDRMADPNHNCVPYLHLPMQSGSDRVLKAMRRHYSKAEYISFLYHAYDKVPGLSVGTDVILGTPDETEEDFQETLNFIKEHPIDYAHAFTYSEREGTTDYPKKHIPMGERKQRTDLIRNMSYQKQMEFGARHLGQTVSVLVEEKSNGYWQGHTENFMLVKFKSRSKLENQIVEVALEEPCGEWVLGKYQP